ncbi:hypothetical protein C8Q79DRAFT_514562 [Trametes meyenii]|nr:hypothetical protein C8Q79DRAFT_514562 [Trametes meyenii]
MHAARPSARSSHRCLQYIQYIAYRRTYSFPCSSPPDAPIAKMIPHSPSRSLARSCPPPAVHSDPSIPLRTPADVLV